MLSHLCFLGSVPNIEKLDEELRVKVAPSWKAFLEGQQTSTKNVSDLVREALEKQFPRIKEASAAYGNKPKGKRHP